MKLVFVNIMQELQKIRFDGVYHAATGSASDFKRSYTKDD